LIFESVEEEDDDEMMGDDEVRGATARIERPNSRQ
jgi:hypothetical protein